MNNQSTSYQIQLPHFQGPFDLLLFFIERDELDIYDIPISKITDDFLTYIRTLETMDIDGAAEFILVASTLMRIKAKMLLPRREINELGEEIDPREELVQKLLEYKQFKAVVQELQELEHNRSLQQQRGYVKKEVHHILDFYATESELHRLSLYKLMNAFHKAIDKQSVRNREAILHQVSRYPFSIADEKSALFNLATEKSSLSFEELFNSCESIIHAVFRFLALLELIQEGDFQLQVGKGYNHLFIHIVDKASAAA